MDDGFNSMLGMLQQIQGRNADAYWNERHSRETASRFQEEQARIKKEQRQQFLLQVTARISAHTEAAKTATEQKAAIAFANEWMKRVDPEDRSLLDAATKMSPMGRRQQMTLNFTERFPRPKNKYEDEPEKNPQMYAKKVFEQMAWDSELANYVDGIQKPVPPSFTFAIKDKNYTAYKDSTGAVQLYAEDEEELKNVAALNKVTVAQLRANPWSAQGNVMLNTDEGAGFATLEKNLLDGTTRTTFSKVKDEGGQTVKKSENGRAPTAYASLSAGMIKIRNNIALGFAGDSDAEKSDEYRKAQMVVDRMLASGKYNKEITKGRITDEVFLEDLGRIMSADYPGHTFHFFPKKDGIEIIDYPWFGNSTLAGNDRFYFIINKGLPEFFGKSQKTGKEVWYDYDRKTDTVWGLDGLPKGPAAYIKELVDRGEL